MALWWIGNALFLFAIIPVVATLLHNLRAPVLEIQEYADDALEHGVLLIANLDAVDDLVETRDRVRILKDQLATYVGHVGRILA